jgi:hypothetical protein
MRWLSCRFCWLDAKVVEYQSDLLFLLTCSAYEAAEPNFIQSTVNAPAGAFESNIVHYDVESFEAMANKLCANIVSSLLVDAGETYHGQLSQDWALRGNRTASIYSVIQCASSHKICFACFI